MTVAYPPNVFKQIYTGSEPRVLGAEAFDTRPADLCLACLLLCYLPARWTHPVLLCRERVAA